MTATLTWQVAITAIDSICHAGQTRGTDTLLRREYVITDKGIEPVPVISGNALRGRLRRSAEEMWCDALGLEGELTVAAAYALRNGGSLYKTGLEPLTGRRRAELRERIIPLAVFGAAIGDAIVDGCLQVGKVYPVAKETERITGIAAQHSVFDLIQLEEYSRLDDVDQAASSDHDHAGNQMRFGIETFPAGTQFATRIQLTRATDAQISFVHELLDRYAATGQLGGRLASGHGRIRFEPGAPTMISGAVDPVEWRTYTRDHRDEIAAAMEALT